MIGKDYCRNSLLSRKCGNFNKPQIGICETVIRYYDNYGSKYGFCPMHIKAPPVGAIIRWRDILGAKFVWVYPLSLILFALGIKGTLTRKKCLKWTNCIRGCLRASLWAATIFKGFMTVRLKAKLSKMFVLSMKNLSTCGPWPRNNLNPGAGLNILIDILYAHARFKWCAVCHLEIRIRLPAATGKAGPPIFRLQSAVWGNRYTNVYIIEW
jgi:NADH:ubiquinone oxidoreductase subunit K